MAESFDGVAAVNFLFHFLCSTRGKVTGTRDTQEPGRTMVLGTGDRLSDSTIMAFLACGSTHLPPLLSGSVVQGRCWNPAQETVSRPEYYPLPETRVSLADILGSPCGSASPNQGEDDGPWPDSKVSEYLENVHTSMNPLERTNTLLPFPPTRPPTPGE